VKRREEIKRSKALTWPGRQKSTRKTEKHIWLIQNIMKEKKEQTAESDSEKTQYKENI